VPGVDALMVGALDLSGSMGLLGQTGHPEVEAAIQRVLAASRKTGLPCGIVAGSPEQAERRYREGFRGIVLGLDVLYLLGGASAALAQVNAALKS
jgi:2-keto-3-deoxy-L-rhamnonate aldolase RhmA